MKLNLLPSVLAISFLALVRVEAAQLITSLNTAYTQNFDAFAGTVETLPNDFTFTPIIEGLTYNGYYNRTDTYVNSSRVYGLRDSALSTDIAFGLKNSTTGNSTLDWKFTNGTGASISSFQVSWDFEQYSESGRSSRLSLVYSANNAAFTNLGISGVSESSAQTRSTSPGAQNLSSIRTESLLVTITLDTPLQPGEDIIFRWNFGIGTLDGTSNNNAHIGIDNLSVTAIPEPSTVAMLVGSISSLLLLRKK